MGTSGRTGMVGARNDVAVIPSVTCANDVAMAICRQVQGTVTYLASPGVLPAASGSGAGDGYADQLGLKS